MGSENLEPRVSALENQVRDLTGRVRGSEHDAAAARVLAGAADRDVSDSAANSAISAVPPRQVSMPSGRTSSTSGRTSPTFGGMFDQGFTEMRGKFDAAAAGQQQIVELIQTVINDQGRRGPGAGG